MDEAKASERYIYHYHAYCQPQSGMTAHSDGIAVLDFRVADFAGYIRLKELIAERMDSKPDAARLIVCSLTLLSAHKHIESLKRSLTQFAEIDVPKILHALSQAGRTGEGMKAHDRAMWFGFGLTVAAGVSVLLHLWPSAAMFGLFAIHWFLKMAARIVRDGEQ